MSQVQTIQPNVAGDASASSRAAWDDAPLRAKLTLLIMLAAVCGCLIGMAEAYVGHRAMLLAPALGVALMLLVWMGRRWVCAPLEQLVEQVDQVLQGGRPSVDPPLPVTRRDELGRLARAVLQVATQSLRDHQEVSRLRRTLDHRVAQATRRATRQLEQLAMRDPLTDLGNRRFLQTSLQPLLESVREADSDLVCLVMDLDNFKKLNDTQGHAAGDELLIFVAGLIRATIRHDDYAVRLGGDEFVVLMPNCSVERAEQFGRQLIALFTQHSKLLTSTEPRVSLSIGMASLKGDGCVDGEKLIDLADARLLDAKRAGKGRVVAG